MDKIGEWQLERYARMTFQFIEESKEWKTLDYSSARPLSLNLTKAGILTVQVGRLLQEYWNLLQVKDMKVHTRGDCMMFLCRAKNDVHKWRVKFAGGEAVGEIRCNTCARAVNSFLVSPNPVLPSLQGLQSVLPAPSQPRPQPALPIVSLQGLQPAPSTASLQGIQPAPPTISLQGFQTIPPTASLKGLQPAPTASLQGLQHPAFSLSGLHSAPSAFQPVLPPAAPLPRAALAPASVGIYPSNPALTPQANVTSGTTQENLTTAATALTLTAGESARMVTNSAPNPTTQEVNPAKAAHSSNLTEIFGDTNLEQLVRIVLQDPSLPEFVDVVHKIISNM